MTKLRHAALALAAIPLATGACTRPADVSVPVASDTDKNAKIVVKDTLTGFTVDVRYSRYQFVPETGALIIACRSLATGRVTDEVKRRGRAIEPFDEQQVRVSTGRNIINARTSCRAFVEVTWRK